MQCDGGKKAKLADFVKYLKDKKLGSVRLFTGLGYYNEDNYCGSEINRSIDDIRYITDKSLSRYRNIGKRTVAEFNELRTNYLLYLDSNEADSDTIAYEEIKREKYSCMLRSEIADTLKTIENEINFVEIAFLEKFNRDGIQLVKLRE